MSMMYMTDRKDRPGRSGVFRGADAASCAGCALVGRRAFLESLGAAVAGALVTLGASPHAAAAMPIGRITALARTAQETTYAIPAADGAQIDDTNGAIVARWQDKAYVFSLGCTHQNTALEYSAADNQFQCPKHHSRFGLDGTYVKDSGRATRDLDRFAVRKDGTTIVADLDNLYQQNLDGPKWVAAFITV